MPRTGLPWLSRLRKPQKPSDASAPDRAVHNARLAGTAAAYRRMVSVLAAAQLLLWLMLSANDPGAQTLWQTALLLLPIGLGVWAVSRLAWGRGATRRPWEWCLLWLCLTGDGILLLHTLLSVLNRLMPSYPMAILRAVIPLLLIAGALLGRTNGAAYGIGLWRWMLPLLALPALWQSLTTNGFHRLYPLLGVGLGHTLGLIPGGLGAIWPLALLFVLPPRMPPDVGEKRRQGMGYALLPLAGLCLCALALCCASPWTADGNPSPGRLMLQLGRSCTVPAAGLYTLFCLLLLMLSFCGTLHAGRHLAVQAMPRLKGWLAVLITALPALAAVWLCPEELPPWVTGLLPWRLLVWGAAAGWALAARYIRPALPGRRKAGHSHP